MKKKNTNCQKTHISNYYIDQSEDSRKKHKKKTNRIRHRGTKFKSESRRHPFIQPSIYRYHLDDATKYNNHIIQVVLFKLCIQILAYFNIRNWREENYIYYLYICCQTEHSCQYINPRIAHRHSYTPQMGIHFQLRMTPRNKSNKLLIFKILLLIVGYRYKEEEKTTFINNNFFLDFHQEIRELFGMHVDNEYAYTPCDQCLWQWCLLQQLY